MHSATAAFLAVLSLPVMSQLSSRSKKAFESENEPPAKRMRLADDITPPLASSSPIESAVCATPSSLEDSTSEKLDIRSLPEGALLALFDLVSAPLGDAPWVRRRCFGFIFRSAGAPVPKPEYAAVVDGRSPYLGRTSGAHALAATSRRLAEVFRTACVSTLLVNPRVPLPGEDEGVMSVEEDVIGKSLRRFPAVDTVVFNHTMRMSQFSTNFVRVVGAPKHGIIRVVLRRLTFQIGNIDELKTAFPDLSELVLLKCVVDDIDLVMLSWRFGSSLKKLRLLGMKQHERGLFSDAGAVGLHTMKELRVLCMDRQSNFTSRTFLQLGKLAFLETVNVDNTLFDDASANALLNLNRLRNLSVANCRRLTHVMLAFLPANLESLNISQTNVLTSNTPARALQLSPPVVSKSLVTLQADQIVLENWKQLSNASSLRQVYMRKCNIPSTGALEVFMSLGCLRRLDISGCSRFGVSRLQPLHADPVADAAIEAIAYLATRIKELRVDETGLTCTQWVAIIAKVMASGMSTSGLVVLTLTKPEVSRDPFRHPDYTSRKLVEAVPMLIRRTFRHAELRYRDPPRPGAQQQPGGEQ